MVFDPGNHPLDSHSLVSCVEKQNPEGTSIHEGNTAYSSPPGQPMQQRGRLQKRILGTQKDERSQVRVPPYFGRANSRSRSIIEMDPKRRPAAVAVLDDRKVGARGTSPYPPSLVELPASMGNRQQEC